MLKCWSHVPEERPTFDQLTKKLWDLEHSESSYVNLNSLLRQSMESEGKQVRYTKTQQTGAHIRWGQGRRGYKYRRKTVYISRKIIVKKSIVWMTGCLAMFEQKLFDCRDISLFIMHCLKLFTLFFRAGDFRLKLFFLNIFPCLCSGLGGLGWD